MFKQQLAIGIQAAALALAACCASGAAHAADWGDLTGHVVIDGKGAKLAPIPVQKDQAVCGKQTEDDALIVDEKGNLANVVVRLLTEKPDVHPDYAKSDKDKITLDNVKCHFVPHVLVLRTTQTLKLHNADPVSHNAKGEPFNPLNKPHAFNPSLAQNGSQDVQLPNEEKTPLKVLCSIHDFMNGYVVVQANPYAVITDKGGKFTIKNLPAGKELEFQLWHEKAGYLRNLTVHGQTTDLKGRLKMTVKPGVNDLGDIKIPVALVVKAPPVQAAPALAPAAPNGQQSEEKKDEKK